jgi:hypothetical protein
MAVKDVFERMRKDYRTIQIQAAIINRFGNAKYLQAKYSGQNDRFSCINCQQNVKKKKTKTQKKAQDGKM